MYNLGGVEDVEEDVPTTTSQHQHTAEEGIAAHHIAGASTYEGTEDGYDEDSSLHHQQGGEEIEQQQEDEQEEEEEDKKEEVGAGGVVGWGRVSVWSFGCWLGGCLSGAVGVGWGGEGGLSVFFLGGAVCAAGGWGAVCVGAWIVEGGICKERRRVGVTCSCGGQKPVCRRTLQP